VMNPSVWDKFMYPSGILCLSSYLEDNGFPNIILDSKDFPINTSPGQREAMIVEKVGKIKPRIVCFSSTHKEFAEVVRMNKELSSANPRIITIVGGSQPTYRAEDFLDNGFNFVGIGEGERILLEFARQVNSLRPSWSRVSGLAWKNGKANVFNVPGTLLTEDELNSITTLAYDKIDERFFDINAGTIRGFPLRGALLLTSRGCPFACTYCGCNKIFGRKLRFKSPELIEREIRYLKDRRRVEGVWIIDDTFTVNQEHALRVAQILKKYGLLWGCQSRVDTINEELIKAMKESGCIQIDFGVESGSQRILDEVMEKNITVEQIFNAFALAKKYRIRTLANFMIGLPTESYSDLKKTEDVAARIRSEVYVFSIATPLPGTKLFDMVGEKIRPEEYSLLSWNGSALTERLNKSGIAALTQERDHLHRKYYFKSLLKLVFSPSIYIFFIRSPYKFQRARFALQYILKHLKEPVDYGHAIK